MRGARESKSTWVPGSLATKPRKARCRLPSSDPAAWVINHGWTAIQNEESGQLEWKLFWLRKASWFTRLDNTHTPPNKTNISLIKVPLKYCEWFNSLKKVKQCDCLSWNHGQKRRNWKVARERTKPNASDKNWLIETRQWSVTIHFQIHTST